MSQPKQQSTAAAKDLSNRTLGKDWINLPVGFVWKGRALLGPMAFLAAAVAVIAAHARLLTDAGSRQLKRKSKKNSVREGL